MYIVETELSNLTFKKKVAHREDKRFANILQTEVSKKYIYIW